MNNQAVGKFGAAYEYSGFWIRVGASLIDGIIILFATYPLLYMIYGDEIIHNDTLVIGGADFLLSYVMPFIATMLFWFYKSATPGKMAVKAIVVDAATGNSPTIKQCIIRYLGYIVATLPLGLGILWVAWDSKKQGWHDKMAGTVVIRPKNKGVEKVEFAGS
ncbi:RDD family protein [Endozoicomonas gorgoniicola]|uniref:RDD family protein n=1 Tax=Endozoicomonas gorgoniicola TaxID=1234144 RepID=A0ABT3MUE9_9GAMM|nr:RDD family protein [Endozoicomonas gorgoniicola]MCW7553010.1 RDD family protein [Endozoicomonas gorgoniicola]